jgi:hypothetical protein
MRSLPTSTLSRSKNEIRASACKPLQNQVPARILVMAILPSRETQNDAAIFCVAQTMVRQQTWIVVKYGRTARLLVQTGTAAQSASPPFSLSGAIAHDFQFERTIA